MSEWGPTVVRDEGLRGFVCMFGAHFLLIVRTTQRDETSIYHWSACQNVGARLEDMSAGDPIVRQRRRRTCLIILNNI